MKAETNSKKNSYRTAWENYLAAEEDAARTVAREVREFVENDALEDGRPRYAWNFAAESSRTKCHRGAGRKSLSRGQRVVKAPDGNVVDLRHYCWIELVFRRDDGTLEPVADVTFAPAHLDTRSKNRHAALNVIAVEPPSDGFDHPEKIHYVGPLSPEMDEDTLKKLTDEVDRAIVKYCEENNIDARSGRPIA